MLKIYIPTLNRVGKQHTFQHLPEKLKKQTTLVCPLNEVKLHTALNYQNVLGCAAKGIGKTRQYILEHAAANGYDKIVMLDDDLRFDWRRLDERGKFYVATEAQVLELFKSIETNLKNYVHVGVLAREGGNRCPTEFMKNTRMLRVLAYNVPKFFAAEVRYDRLPVMEDFDVTLQLLRKGFPNLLLCNWVNGQGSSNAAGGCSTYRTMEVQEMGAKMLAKKHPEFVKLVRKQTKAAWNGQERTDVMIQWKKAFESSQV